jgi:hypothetical protein
VYAGARYSGSAGQGFGETRLPSSVLGCLGELGGIER